MNKAKLKVLLAALREVVEELESEIYSDTQSYLQDINYKVSDYDEVFEDDDDDHIKSLNNFTYYQVNDDDGDGL
jgi:hypothetical protein